MLNEISSTWPDFDMGLRLYPKPNALATGSWFSHFSGSTDRDWSTFTLNIDTNTQTPEKDSVSLDVNEFVETVMREEIVKGLEMMIYEVDASPMNWLKYQREKNIQKGAPLSNGDITLDRILAQMNAESSVWSLGQVTGS